MIAELPTRLREVLTKALNRGLSWREVEQLLDKVFRDFSTPSEFRDQLSSEVRREYDWTKDRTANPQERQEIKSILSRSAGEFAKTKDGIRRDVKRRVIKALKDGEPNKTIRDELESLGLRYRHYAETIRRTAKSGFGGVDFYRKAKEAGVEYFTYIGPAAERGFCVEHLNRTYHIDEIRRMSNGQGLPVLYYKGGWNCRHQWVKASKAEIDNRRIVEKDISELGSEAEVIAWAKHHVADKVSFADFSDNPNGHLGTIKEIAGTVRDMQERFGLPRLSELGQTIERNAFYDYGVRRVTVGNTILNHLIDIGERNRRNNTDPREMHSFHNSNNMTDIIIHEMGHCFHDMNWNDFVPFMLRNWLREREGDPPYITDYSSYDIQEFAAEHFSMYVHGVDGVGRRGSTIIQVREVKRIFEREDRDRRR